MGYSPFAPTSHSLGGVAGGASLLIWVLRRRVSGVSYLVWTTGLAILIVSVVLAASRLIPSSERPALNVFLAQLNGPWCATRTPRGGSPIAWRSMVDARRGPARRRRRPPA